MSGSGEIQDMQSISAVTRGGQMALDQFVLSLDAKRYGALSLDIISMDMFMCGPTEYGPARCRISNKSHFMWGIRADIISIFLTRRSYLLISGHMWPYRAIPSFHWDRSYSGSIRDEREQDVNDQY